MTHRKVPIDRVGLYVPGGLAPLVSSVVMNVVPAQVAGVRSIALASPPQKGSDGLPEPTIMAACALLGVDEVYAVGGAQAIAMFAYGAGPCERVDLVTGPGNIYVAAAKRLLRGVVGIDSEAGPTEIAILADDTAEAAFVAADLISQAEHDPMAASVLVTDSLDLADAVEAELDKQVFATRHTERISTALGGRQSGIVLVDDIDQGVDVVNAYAAEHLEIHTRDAAAHAARVRNAGAIFVGPWAPVSLGDYCAGSNHVLPTAGCACHSSGLSVRAFTQVGARRRLLPGGAGRGRRPRRDAGRGRGPARPRPGRVGPVRPTMTQRAFPPLREELRGIEPYGAPQLGRRRCSSTSTRTPTVPRPRRWPTSPRPSATAATTLNRYPDREFVELREGAGGVPQHVRRHRHHPRHGVGGQRVQRGDAAAAAGLRRPRSRARCRSRRRTRCIPSTPATR